MLIEQQLNLLELYSAEIISRFSSNYKSLKPIKLLIQESDLEDLFKEAEKDGNWKRFGENLWHMLKNSPMNSLLYSSILRFLMEVDLELHQMLNIAGYKHENVLGFTKLLSFTKPIIYAMELEIIFDILSSISNIFSDVLEPIRTRHRNGEIDEYRAKCLILRCIPTMGLNSCEHLLFALQKCSNKGKHIVNTINPYFEQDYEEIISGPLNSKGILHIVSAETTIHDVVKAALTYGKNSTFAIDLRFGDIYDSKILRSCEIDICKETPLNLRSYQQELAEEALKGNNAIICAPTGSGKTVIAAYIIRQHIYTCRRLKKNAKVCFMVPTTTILAQQYDLLKKYLGHCANVVTLKGDDQKPEREIINVADVIIIMPQIIVNLLQTKPIDGFDTFKSFSLTTFSLMVFDEAHHADEMHPYNVIMQYYHDSKFTKNFPIDRTLPQILGLTASLGTGGSKNVEATVDHLIKLCANLDIQFKKSVCLVRENKQQMMEYISNAQDDVHLCEASHLSTPFYVELCELIQYFEDTIFGIPEASDESVSKILTKEKQSIANYVGYQSWFNKLRGNDGILSCYDMLSTSSYQTITEALDHIDSIYRSMEYLRLFDSDTMLDVLQNNTINKNNEMLQKIRLVISKLRNIQPFQSSILEKLFHILTNHFKQHAKDGRVMIFVKERLYAIELTRLIKKYLININVDFLTGITEKVELGGTKPERQNQVIQEFSSGAIQVLVTTSVSEEGLDIAKCNLVIKYSYVTNEIAHVQRRGRGRDLSSKCMLLTNDEKEKKKEDLNVIAESMMFEAMNIMVQIPSDDFVRRVDETIQELYKKREEARALAQEKSMTLKANARSYRLLCWKCGGYVTNATQLRTYQKSQFVVSDKTFWERVSCKEIPLEERIPRAPDVGLYFCMNIKKVDGTICGYNLGRVTIIRNIYLPYVNCKSITFEKTLLPADQLDRVGSTSEIFNAKKWKEVITKHFEPKEIEGIDLKEMQMALKRPEFVIHNPQNAGEFLADSAGVPMEEEDSNVPSSVNS